MTRAFAKPLRRKLSLGANALVYVLAGQVITQARERGLDTVRLVTDAGGERVT